jgi:hypothetical protein
MEFARVVAMHCARAVILYYTGEETDKITCSYFLIKRFVPSASAVQQTYDVMIVVTYFVETASRLHITEGSE